MLYHSSFFIKWILIFEKEEISEFYRHEIIWEIEDGKNQEDVCKDHKIAFEKMKVDEKEHSLFWFNTLLKENYLV